jgi:hypothetical protein
MNSTIKTAKVPEALNQSNETNNKKGIQHTKARLGESFKNKGKTR